MAEAPLVSIITPAYNCREFIEETAQSIRVQSLEDWEWVVVDDQSDDGTYEWLVELQAEEPRLRLHRNEQNGGPAVSRNHAIAKAQGRYIAFIDSDDLWMPDKLQRQLSFMRDAGAALSHTSYQKMSEDGERGGVVNARPLVTRREMLSSNYIACSTAIYDTQRLGKVYMPDIRKRQDHGLWLRILGQIQYAHGLDEVLALYRVRSNSISSNKLDAARYSWRLLREVEGLGRVAAAWHFGRYALLGARKHLK